MALDLDCTTCLTDDHVVLVETLTGTQRRLRCEQCGYEWLRGEPAPQKVALPTLGDIKKRFPKPGDSGVYLRGKSKSQVNIWCREMGSGEVWGYRTDNSQPEEVRKGCTPIKKADKPIGQWNTFVITMRGERLTVKLNGELVIHAARLPGVPPEGEIALQRHGNPIDFKNIYIKEIE